MPEHDGGYKLLFSHPSMVEALLRGFVRESWVEDILIDESRLTSEQLALAGNRVATLFRLETAMPEDLDLPDLAADFTRLLPRKDEDPALRRTLHRWLVRRLRRLLPGVTIPDDDFEEMPMLEETLIEWRDNLQRESRRAGREEGQREGKKEGKREGKREGKIEGLRQILLYQLEQRFGTLPPQVRRKVRDLSSVKRLEELAKRVLVAGSLAEMGIE